LATGLALSGALLAAVPATQAGLILAENFEAQPPQFGWYLDNDNGGTRYVVVETNGVFGSMALHYHLAQTATGQQEAIGQLLTPVDISSDSVSNLTVQFDFYLDNPAAPLKKAFNFGIGSSSGTPLTADNQLAAEASDDRGYNAYIGWQLPYCRIQYQTAVGADGHGRGGTLVAVDPAAIQIPANHTIGTARMTLTKAADNTYEIKVEYRVGAGGFVTGATGTYARLATSFDQILVGFGIHGATDGVSDIYLDNLLIYTNGEADYDKTGFLITEIICASNSVPRLKYLSDTNYYYILYSGGLTNIVLPTAAALGTAGMGELAATNTCHDRQALFFRVRRVPLSQPLDTDGDGLDDVFELRHQPTFNPLDPSDGTQFIAAYHPTEILDGDPLSPVINADIGPFSKAGANTFPIGESGKTIQHPLRFKRVVWSLLETSQGVYDFSQFDSELAIARSATGLVWWAVYNMKGAGANSGTWVPPYLAVAPYGQMVNGTWLPDFENAFFKARFAALIQAISNRYAHDPRVYAFDMRAWGPYGENNTWRGPNNNLPPYSVSDQTKRFYIDLYRSAFPRQQLFVMIDDLYTVNYILNLSSTAQPKPISLRADSWGNSSLDSYPAQFAAAYPASSALLNDRWKVAPVGGEPWGVGGTTASLFLAQMSRHHAALMANGNLGSPSDWSSSDQAAFRAAFATVGYRFAISEVTAPRSVRAGGGLRLTVSWLNRGVTPSYRPWRVEWRLYDWKGTLTWSAPSATDLHAVLPSTTALTVTDTYALPAIAAGCYTLRLAVVDPEGTIGPMALAAYGRVPDGSYNLNTNGGAVWIDVLP
jgi:hypothetical protein